MTIEQLRSVVADQLSRAVDAIFTRPGDTPMHRIVNAWPDMAGVVVDTEDEALAAHSTARLLISAATQSDVESVARRVHDGGTRARYPFTRLPAGDLPSEAEMLRATCSRLLDATAGGSVLIYDIERMPPGVQPVILELVADLAARRSPAAAVRLVAGTTVSLPDRVKAGTFSPQLFYRLNVIHLRPAASAASILTT